MSKVKVIILSIAIALVTVFFLAYAIQSFYPSPSYEDYCNETLRLAPVDSQAACVAIGGQWQAYDQQKNEDSSAPTGWCNREYTCAQEYHEVNDVYERNVFFANLIVGLAVLVLAFFLSLEAVSAGLMAGAVMLIFYGTVRYWGELSDIWRTIVLGITLVVLVWLGYKKLSNN
jgi:hypothetical protein